MGLFHDESDGAGNVFRLKRRQELVPTGLAVRFHILEYLGTGCAGRNKSDLYPRTGQFDPERVREHLQRAFQPAINAHRSEEHTSELQSLMLISNALFCLNNKTNTIKPSHAS